MQAVNHIATALILKRAYPKASLFGLILATEAVEFLWVGLNLIGVERTVIAQNMRSVADIELVYMPYSHSLLTSLIAAIIIGLLVWWRTGRTGASLAWAISLAVFSHIILDLFVHAPDIQVMPSMSDVKLGTGLYNQLPFFALGVETAWGILCWWIFRGNWKLLGLLILAAATSVPFYSITINTGEAMFAGQSQAFAFVILVQIALTSVLVWWFAKDGPGLRKV